MVGKTLVRETQDGDAEDLAPRLREMDVFEAKCVIGIDVVDALKGSIDKADTAWTYLIDGKIYAICGISYHPPSYGCIWQVGSKEVEENVRDYLVATKQFVALQKERFSTIMNVVHSKNEKSIRYIRHMGFTFAENPVPVGGEPFLYFYWRRDDDVS